MKTPAFLCALALGLTAACGVHAQDHSQAPAGAAAKHHAPDPQQQAARLSKQLQLSPDQTTKIQAILEERRQKLQALKNGSAKGPERREQAKAITQDEDQKLQAVLTDSQRQRFLHWRENMLERRQEQQGMPSQAAGGKAPSPAQSPAQ
jgi:hypothetical protein